MRVGVITTGKAELAGLHVALARLFPGHEFLPIPWRKPDIPFTGVTSGRIDESAPVDLQSATGKIVSRAAATLEDHDRVIVLDDLELENLGRTALVLDYVRAHVRAYLRRFSESYGQFEADDLAHKLRTRASFHIAVPMLESWFFADPAALATMNVKRMPRFAPGAEPERFKTNDPDYDTDDCSSCTTWLAIADPKKRNNSCPEWDRVDRQLHPKAYLAWLMKDPNNKRCSRYRETEHGAQALRTLDWQSALANGGHCSYMRALVLDLSIALNVPLPWLNTSHHPALTDYVWPGRVLGNI